MVEVESKITCSSIEAGLVRYLGELGGERNNTSGSVDKAGPEVLKDRKSAFRLEGRARVLSLEEQPSEVSAMESGKPGIITSIELYRTWPKTINHPAAIKMLGVSSVEPNLTLELSKREEKTIANSATGFQVGKVSLSCRRNSYENGRNI